MHGSAGVRAHLHVDAKIVAIRDGRRLEADPHLASAKLCSGDRRLFANEAAQLGDLWVDAAAACLNSRLHRVVDDLQCLRWEMRRKQAGNALCVRRQGLDCLRALVEH